MEADGRRVCAWCGRDLPAARRAGGAVQRTTHGLCTTCLDERMAEMRVPGVNVKYPRATGAPANRRCRIDASLLQGNAGTIDSEDLTAEAPPQPDRGGHGAEKT